MNKAKEFSAERAHSKVLKKSTSAFSRGVHHVRSRIHVLSNPRISIKEQTFFAKRLSFLIKANIPILESLLMVSEQSDSFSYKRIVDTVSQDIANGQSLAKSLGKFPNVFGEFGINIIKVGESSGTLSQNLDYLAEELRKRQILKRKVISAFVYPAIITTATIAITAFLIFFLFPKIMPVFISLHVTLPFTTRALIAITLFLQHWGLELLAVIIAIVIGVVVMLKRSPAFHYAFDRVVLGIPAFGFVIRRYNLANLSRTMGLLLRSGLTATEALSLAGDTTRNLVYKKDLQNASEGINRGAQISTYLLSRPAIFPNIFGQMIAVGERTGNLSNTCTYLAELYEAEVDDFTKNLSSLIEPVLMIIMGIIVGFVAISIITPIYGVTQSIHP